jgi:hypothetical protein
MPVTIIIDASLRMVFSKATGVFTYRDALWHIDALSVSASFDRTFNQWVDIREAKIGMTVDEVRNFAFKSVFSPTTKRAFLLTAGMDDYLVSLFDIYREVQGENGIRVFQEASRALAWLNLTEEPSAAMYSRGLHSP